MSERERGLDDNNPFYRKNPPRIAVRTKLQRTRVGDRGGVISMSALGTIQARPSTKVARKLTTTTNESAFQNFRLVEATGKWGSNMILHR